MDDLVPSPGSLLLISPILIYLGGMYLSLITFLTKDVIYHSLYQIIVFLLPNCFKYDLPLLHYYYTPMQYVDLLS